MLKISAFLLEKSKILIFLYGQSRRHINRDNVANLMRKTFFTCEASVVPIFNMILTILVDYMTEELLGCQFKKIKCR